MKLSRGRPSRAGKGFHWLSGGENPRSRFAGIDCGMVFFVVTGLLIVVSCGCGNSSLFGCLGADKESSFSIEKEGAVEMDGHVYRTVTIGEQERFA